MVLTLGRLGLDIIAEHCTDSVTDSDFATSVRFLASMRFDEKTTPLPDCN